jgi:hypothetical protein
MQRIQNCKTLDELNKNWSKCFIIGLRKVKTKKKLIEAFNLGIAIKYYEDKII